MIRKSGHDQLLEERSQAGRLNPEGKCLQLAVNKRETGQQPVYQVMFVLLEQGLPLPRLGGARANGVTMDLCAERSVEMVVALLDSGPIGTLPWMVFPQSRVAHLCVRALFHLSRWIQIRRYPGSVDVFASDSAEARLFSFWKHLVRGRLSFHRIPGGHHEIMSPEHLPELAKSLKIVLQRAQKEYQGDPNREHSHAP